MDDERYAAGRAAALAGRGFGDEAIRAFLDADGIGAEEVEAAVATLPPERDRAVAFAARLGRTPKAAATLQRKGFGPDAISAAFPSLFADEGAEA